MMSKVKFGFTVILILVSISFSFSQEKNGSFQEFFETGELRQEGQYKNGKRFGEWKNYYKNGNISTVHTYSDGKKDRANLSYYENGQVSEKIEKVGNDNIKICYYESGKLLSEKNLDKGDFKGYFESGEVEIISQYEKNELSGKWKRYYKNGNLDWKVNYSKGYKTGIYQHFYEDGDLRIEGTNVENKKYGEEKHYLPNMILQWKGKMHKGEFSKVWFKYNKEGEQIAKLKFRNGKATDAELGATIESFPIPDGIPEKLPVYSGCEDFVTNSELKACMNVNVNTLINKKFNTGLALKLNLEGRQKVNITFDYDKSGVVTNIRADASHIKIEEEAIRVIKLLPNAIPGYRRCKAISTSFEIPIMFRVYQN